MNTRPINKAIIQCVDVANASILIANHKEKGLAMVGFHYIIERDGTIVEGRPIGIIGTHLIGENSHSIGIACIGKVLTKKQESSIDSLLEELELKAPNVKEVFVLEGRELTKYK